MKLRNFLNKLKHSITNQKNDQLIFHMILNNESQKHKHIHNQPMNKQVQQIADLKMQSTMHDMQRKQPKKHKTKPQKLAMKQKDCGQKTKN